MDGTKYSFYQSPGAHVSPLIFWLGGLPNVSGTPAGFSLDPTNPILGDRTLCEAPYYAFNVLSIDTYDKKRKKTRTVNYATYKTPNLASKNVIGVVPVLKVFDKPLAYFTATDRKDGLGAYEHPMALRRELSTDADVLAQTPRIPKYYSYLSSEYAGTSSADEKKRRPVVFGSASPYAKGWITVGEETLPEWYEPERYQMIYTGEDGLFGDWDIVRSSMAGKTHPHEIRVRDVSSTGKYGQNATFCAGATAIGVRCTRLKENLSERDDDNIVNFTRGGTLSSEYD